MEFCIVTLVLRHVTIKLDKDTFDTISGIIWKYSF